MFLNWVGPRDSNLSDADGRQWSGGDPSEETPYRSRKLFENQTLQLSKQGRGSPTPQSPSPTKFTGWAGRHGP